jgi:CheY-like chemotaxis protein
VSISVHDTGRGIPKDQIDNVFDPFFTTKDVGEGSGLGLSMVYGFAKQSGGYVTIDSTEGAGTNVTMYLPRAEAVVTEDTDAEPVANAEQGGGARIMVIEDDEDVREVTTVALEKLGYEVVDGGDGSEAVKIGNAQEDGIDLLLTDVVLPHGNSGPNLAETLCEKWRQMKVLMMTGYAENELLRSLDNELKYPVIHKPFRTVELNKKIQDVLAIKHN